MYPKAGRKWDLTAVYFTGKADYVMCSICDIEVNDWARDDMVHERHALESPNCPLVLG